MYKKGFLFEHKFKINRLFWVDEYSFKFKELFIVAFEVRDCEGEYGYRGFIDYIIESLYWKHAIDQDYDAEAFWPESNFNFKGRKWFIQYLMKMPTVVFDNKINRLINRKYCDY